MLLMLALTITSVSMYAQTVSASKDSIGKNKIEVVKKYTCSMHPEIITNEPGKCPKCGMDLIPLTKKKTKKKMMHGCGMQM